MHAHVPLGYDDDDYADAGGDFSAAVDKGFEGAFDAFPEHHHNLASASFKGVEPMGQSVRGGGQYLHVLSGGGQSVRGGQYLLQGGGTHGSVCGGRDSTYMYLQGR